MKKVQQNLLCVLLQALLDQELITQEIHDKARVVILDTSDWPTFFIHGTDGSKEENHGCT